MRYSFKNEPAIVGSHYRALSDSRGPLSTSSAHGTPHHRATPGAVEPRGTHAGGVAVGAIVARLGNTIHDGARALLADGVGRARQLPARACACSDDFARCWKSDRFASRTALPIDPSTTSTFPRCPHECKSRIFNPPHDLPCPMSSLLAESMQTGSGMSSGQKYPTGHLSAWL